MGEKCFHYNYVLAKVYYLVLVCLMSGVLKTLDPCLAYTVEF